MASPKMQKKSHIPAHITVSVVHQVQNACPCYPLPSDIDSGCSQTLFFSFEPLSRRHQTQIKLLKRVNAASGILVLVCAPCLTPPPPGRQQRCLIELPYMVHSSLKRSRQTCSHTCSIHTQSSIHRYMYAYRRANGVCITYTHVHTQYQMLISCKARLLT